MNIQLPRYWPVSQHTDRITQGSTYVALKGTSYNGIDFIQEALEKGATTIIVDQPIAVDLQETIADYGAQLQQVDDARRALAEHAAHAWGYPQHHLKIIGATGTKGKTTTTYLLRHTLKIAGFKTAMLSGVCNYILDTSLPAELTTPHADFIFAFLATCKNVGVEYVVMEVSAQGLSLHRVATIQFDAALFTNLSQEHAEFYPTMDHYFAAKKLLFAHTKPGAPKIINTNDQWGVLLAREYPDALTISYKQQATYSIHDVYSDFSGLHYVLREAKQEDVEIKIPSLVGFFNALNSAGVFVVCSQLALSRDSILRSFLTFNGVPGRMERIELANGSLGIVDYAHTPSSFEEVLKAVRPLTNTLIVVFGAGGGKDPIKRPLMGKIVSEIADHVIVTSDNPRFEKAEDIARHIVAGIDASLQHKVLVELDRAQAIRYAYALSEKSSIILVLGKGPDEYQQIGKQKFFFSDKQTLATL